MDSVPGEDASVELRREQDVMGPYRVVEKIAGGGMAEIYKVVNDAKPGKFFAMKRVRSDRSEDIEFKKMLMDEAKIASRLRHKNIARVLSLEEFNGNIGLILEYVDGVDLTRAAKVLRDRSARFP